MKTRLQSACYIAVAAAVLASPIAARADLKYTFTYGALDPIIPGSSNLVSDTLQIGAKDTTTNQVVAGQTVKVSAWADSGAAGDVGKKLYEGNTYSYAGGLGVQWVSPTGAMESLTSPEHSIDNCGSISYGSCTSPTPEDFVLFSFNSAVNLNNVAIGWWQSDSDISILAYTGAGTPNLTQDTYSYTDAAGGTSVGLINNGWSFVGNYNNVNNGYSASTCTSNPSLCSTAVNSGGISSTYWLIGAYNSRVTPNQGADQNNDFLKIASITATQPPPPPPHKAPEPGTLGLLGITLPLLGSSYRRRGWLKKLRGLGRAG